MKKGADMIRSTDDRAEKTTVARAILEALPDWFGIEEARETYIAESAEQAFFLSEHAGAPDGFLCLKETGRDTMELAVMGVRQEAHRTGIGRALFQAARAYAKEAGYSFLQVKTVQMGRYEEYDATNRFYLAMGFKEFEVFKTLWDEYNPCQIYVMAL